MIYRTIIFLMTKCKTIELILIRKRCEDLLLKRSGRKAVGGRIMKEYTSEEHELIIRLNAARERFRGSGSENDARTCERLICALRKLQEKSDV